MGWRVVSVLAGCATATVLAFAVLPSAADAAPTAAPYTQSCTNASVDAHGTLVATCPDFFGRQVRATLPSAAQCLSGPLPGAGPGAIWNVDGTLRCVLSSRSTSRDVFDIVSVVSYAKTPAGETIVWRVDHPDVVDPSKDYPKIAFTAGDAITFNAGGCVQTGGRGDTWKSYVYPAGTESSMLYSGTVWLPGGPGLVRVAGVIGKKFTVPQQSPLAVQPHLVLGYEDDVPADNGYYNHDNGNGNQCLNVGPAWVEVSVSHPSSPAVSARWAPFSKPFDLTWDTTQPADANGLPVNPLWGFQVEHPGAKPDFETTCSAAFSNGDTVRDAVLAQLCTTQQPTTDLFPESFPQSALTGVFGLCKSSLLQGHLNWGYATYQGTLEWRDYSGAWLDEGDYDENFGLVTANNAGETLLSDNGDPGIGLEFDARETVFGSSFWTTFLSEGDAERHAVFDGNPAVVTGLVGIDAVHDGYTEIHPVLALAVRTSSYPAGDGVDETWRFFVRNEGDEGECADHEHFWDSASGTGRYFVQLPWPANATKLTVKPESTDAWGFVNWGGTPVPQPPPAEFTPRFEAQSPWTYLVVQFAPGAALGQGIDGTFVLHYALGSGMSARVVPAASARAIIARPPTAILPNTIPNPAKPIPTASSPQPGPEREFPWKSVAQRIADPAKRQAFTSDLQQSEPHIAVPAHSVRLTIAPDVGAYVAQPGASRTGTLVRDRTGTSPLASARDAALAALAAKYASAAPTRP